MASAPAPAPAGAAQKTVPGVLFEQARRYGEREYIHHFRAGAWHQLSWNQMEELVARVACGLVEAGVKPGDHVALISENRLEWLCCDWGIQAVGGVTVPIYPTSVPATVRYICRDVGAVLAIASGEELAAKLTLESPLRAVLRIDRDITSWLESDPSPQLRAEVERRMEALTADAMATVIYTSGTTGEPKGVILTHRNFVEMATGSLGVFPVTENDVVLSWMPFSHVFERMDGIFLETFAGATIWLGRGMKMLAEDMRVVRPTLMCGVPRVFDKMHDLVYDQLAREPGYKRALFNWAVRTGARKLHGERGALLDLEVALSERLVLRAVARRLTGGRLRCFVSGGAPLNEKVEEFFWVLGVKILQGWGLTETTSGATTNTETRHSYRTVGFAIPGTEIKIAEDGEILVRGPGVMRGYKGKPQATAESIVDGWFKTGDMGFLDADGFLTITDRKKDLIKTAGGKYIAPLPLEAQLEAARLVQAAMVVGDRRPYVVALIVPDFEVLARDHGLSGDPLHLVHDQRVRALYQSLVDAVNKGRASFETVKYFALLPRDFSEAQGELTPSLKPKRKVIQQHFEEVIDELYARGAASVVGTGYRERV